MSIIYTFLLATYTALIPELFAFCRKVRIFKVKIALQRFLTLHLIFETAGPCHIRNTLMI